MGNGQQSKTPVNLRHAMPRVAETVSRWRAEWGDAHVTECIKRGMAGLPDEFYAIEAGHIVGTPFTWSSTAEEALVKQAVMTGACITAMRPPAKDDHGAH